MKQADILPFALLALAGWGAWHVMDTLTKQNRPAEPKQPAPVVIPPIPKIPPVPDCPDGKCPVPGPRPTPRPRPWGQDADAPVGAKVSGPKMDDGTEVACDLPGHQHLKNKGGLGRGGPGTGAGLCVFTSIEHSARWQNVPALLGFRDWMTHHPGGGYPSKVRTMIEKLCKDRGVPVPDYVQVEGGDLDILKRACASGRMPAVTYSRSPTGRYGGSSIAHMVSLPHADDKWFVVLDNNYPGSPGNTNVYEWMTPQEFSRTYAPGWAVILLAPPPPPPPRNGGLKK